MCHKGGKAFIEKLCSASAEICYPFSCIMHRSLPVVFFLSKKKAKISFVMKTEFNRDAFNGKVFSYDKKDKI